MDQRDPRLTPARPDLAASHLRGTVEAARYVDGIEQRVVAGITPMRRAPSHGAMLLTQALHGERVTVYETDDEGWAWGQLAADGYVGFVPSSALLASPDAPTHRVIALRTHAYPEPSIKTPPVAALPMGALVTVSRQQESFSVTAGGFVPSRHLVPVAQTAPDFVSVAEQFLGTPYLWGGKSSLGIDCSGLVQVALTACGIAFPRDSDMQEAALERAVTLDSLKRGDLVFWRGHVAIARDATTLLHANAHHMMVAIEPAGEAIIRIAASGGAVTSVGRIG